MATIYVPLQAR